VIARRHRRNPFIGLLVIESKRFFSFSGCLFGRFPYRLPELAFFLFLRLSYILAPFVDRERDPLFLPPTTHGVLASFHISPWQDKGIASLQFLRLGRRLGGHRRGPK